MRRAKGNRGGQGAASRATALLLATALTAPGGDAAAAPYEPVAARHGMVASISPLASQVGAAVLERGGSAADAAVAVAFALAVTWPSAGNLGGGGFLLWRGADGRSEVIDYRERAPGAASRDMYLDAAGQLVPGASTVGYRAVAVPGTVAGMELFHRRHGQRRWAELLAPAVKLARQGLLVDGHLARSLRDGEKLLGKFPASVKVFFQGGHPLAVGERLLQPDLARTLDDIAAQGARAFYRGAVAERLVADVQAHGGLLTARDLVDFEAKVIPPLAGSYRGYQILTVGPPSSGGVALLEALNLLERFPLPELPWHSADQVHLLIEAMRRAFADRAALLGDTEFVKVPVRGLIDKGYAAERAASIDRQHATPSRSLPPGAPPPDEPPQTTHFTVVDAAGNVVSNTYTLNGGYGCGAVAGGTGVLLNNEMDDFAAKPGEPNLYGLIQGEANAIAPRKRPLSSMTPAIVLKDDQLVLAVGSPGGPTIINTVLQVLVNVLDYGMSLREAIAAPRVHHQYLPDLVFVERFGLSAETRAALEARGHVLAPREARFPSYMGDAEGIMIEAGSGLRLGAADPRNGGAAVGY